MESTGTTVIHQTISQEAIVRNSASLNGLRMEIHKVTTDGSGDATITTQLDKIVATTSGSHGTTAVTCAAVDIDTPTAVATTANYTYPVKGANSTIYFIVVWGIFEGS
jgi:hypothetical protein